MLLNHTSSLRDEGGYSFPIGQSLQSVLDPQGENDGMGGHWALSSSSADRSPGRYFEYVNLNWGVLGTVIEAVSGQRFDRYMKQAVLAPLRIAGGFNAEELSEDEIGNLAVLYRKRSGEEQCHALQSARGLAHPCRRSCQVDAAAYQRG
jgi:CubicO group peptidase (beta-lactamase class C family)